VILAVRGGVLFSVIAGALALPTAPALAHGADAPDATAYRTTVSAVSPAAPGLTVRAVEAGARLELVNRTGRTIEVLGYSGEPYLEVRPDGTFENTNSPATYLNTTLAGDGPVPAGANPATPPTWRRVSHDPTVRWHDRRTQWLTGGLPPPAVADPSRTHRLRDWVVPMRDGVAPLEIRGTLDWVPPPQPAVWWALTLLVAAGTTALALLRRGLPGLLVAAAAVAGTTTIGYAVARELDAGTSGPGGLLAGLVAGHLVPVLVGLGALGAAGLAAARRPAADFALALAGTAVATFAGLAQIGVFAQAIAPVPGPGWWARLAVLTTTGLGTGLAAAGVIRLRAAHRPGSAT
jgi:hypothetical protein